MKVATIILGLVVTFAGVSPAFAVPDLQVFRNGGVAENSSDDIGTRAAGQPATVIYMIVNGGDTTLNLPNGVSVAGAVNGTCVVSVQPNVIVTAGNSSSFTLQFTPTAGGAFRCDLSIPSDDPDQPFTFAMTGTASGSPAAPDITVTGVDFMEGPGGGQDVFVPPGFAPTTRTLTITNTGSGVLTIAPTTTSEDNCTCEATVTATDLQGGQEAILEVRVVPDLLRLFHCRVVIASNDPDEASYAIDFSNAPAGSILEVRGSADGVVYETGATVGLGRGQQYEIEIRNLGREPLIGVQALLEARVSSSTCELVPRIPNELTVDDLGGVIVFSLGGEPFRCTIKISTNDPLTPAFFLSVEGQGQPQTSCSVGDRGGLLIALLVLALTVRRPARTRSRRSGSRPSDRRRDPR